MNHPARSSATATVLLVEHDAALSDVLRGAFENEGYTVEITSHVPSADEVVALHPDMLVVDAARQHASEDWQLVSNLRAHGPSASLPIIVHGEEGAFVSQSDVTLRANVTAILSHPVRLDILLPVAASALASRPASPSEMGICEPDQYEDSAWGW